MGKKKKKFKSRYEKNRYLYIKNTHPKQTKKNNNNKLLLILLIISLLFNSLFLINIKNQNIEITKKNQKIKKEEKEKISLKKAYTNYLFLGDSITDFYDLDKFFKKKFFVNSGISGNTTDDILNDMENRVYNYNPSKVFILIGTNDLNKDKSIDYITNNIIKIIEQIKKNRKETIIYLESIYPVNKKINKKMVANRDNNDIKKINEKIKKYALDNNITYIDTYTLLKDENDNFNELYTDDGLHPNEKGYEVITKEIKKYLD